MGASFLFSGTAKGGQSGVAVYLAKKVEKSLLGSVPDQGCGIYYPRAPAPRTCNICHFNGCKKNQWGQKDKLCRGERGYMMAVLTE